MTRGNCHYCGNSYSKAGMSRHLQSCAQRRALMEGKAGRGEEYYHLTAVGSPDYWMHLKASQRAELEDLDSFLRAAWVECCGHLSAFTIENAFYTSCPEPDFEDNKMDFPLREVLDAGMSFGYQYDFGSTTYVSLKVIGEFEEVPKGRPIQIMARNEAPQFACTVCGSAAAHICTECMYEGEAFFCERCAAGHECGEEMLLPVVNSPRMGVCGYSGSGNLGAYLPA